MKLKIFYKKLLKEGYYFADEKISVIVDGITINPVGIDFGQDAKKFSSICETLSTSKRSYADC